jgi:hypothetical protein
MYELTNNEFAGLVCIAAIIVPLIFAAFIAVSSKRGGPRG